MPIRAGGRAFIRPLALLAIASCAGPTPPPVFPAAPFQAGELLVGFRASATLADRQTARRIAGASLPVPYLDRSEHWTISGDPAALAESVANLPGVQYAQPNYIRKLQAYSANEFDSAVAAKDSLLWHHALTRINKAWGLDGPGGLTAFSGTNPPGKGIIVAVVDSGCDVRHPDLADNIAKDAEGKPRYIDEIAACGRSDVLVAPKLGTLVYDWSTAYRDSTHPGPDGNGHGTHVSGIIAAVGNNSPGAKCDEPPCNAVGTGPGISILPVKTMNAQGDGDDFCIAKGLQDAADNGARVINLSVGGPQPGPTLEEAIVYLTKKGALLVVASGNDGLRVNYPAAYPGVLAVGAIGNPNDGAFPEAMSRNSAYTSRGPELSLVAPGGSDTRDCLEKRCGVYSTLPTYVNAIAITKNSDKDGNAVLTSYFRLTGTSMATPQVSAVAALILAREPGLSPAQVRQRILASTSPVPGTDGAFSERYGYGLLDPLKALSMVSHDGS